MKRKNIIAMYSRGFRLSFRAMFPVFQNCNGNVNVKLGQTRGFRLYSSSARGMFESLRCHDNIAFLVLVFI